jgi:hypothetical protein
MVKYFRLKFVCSANFTPSNPPLQRGINCFSPIIISVQCNELYPDINVSKIAIFKTKMSADNFFIKDQNAVYFLTFTVTDWIDFFTRKEFKIEVFVFLNYGSFIQNMTSKKISEKNK